MTATTSLHTEVRAYVENEGERWAELIEREHQVPLSLWDELRDRGYLRLACESIGRQMPLATCTIIRSEACDIEKSSSSSR